jgi:hypothetical protein
MRNRTDETKTDVIEKLIAMEEEDSLVKFRASDFGTKIRRSVRDSVEGKERFSRWREAPAAAWVSLASVILISAVVVLIIPQKTPGPNMAQMIADVLGQSPPIRALADDAPAETAPQNEVASPMERRILSALLAWIQGPESDRLSGQSTRPASIKPKSGPLSLEETYKILNIDKAVERFLTLMTS